MDEIESPGIAFESGHLYLLSGAYNLLFEVDVVARQVTRTIGLAGLDDSSGMALKDGSSLCCYRPRVCGTVATHPDSPVAGIN